MRYGIFPMVIAMILLSAPLALPAMAWNSDAAEEYTVYGYIAAITDDMNNAPLEGVKVSTFLGTPMMEVVSDEEGRFEFKTNSKSGFLTFHKEGYAIKTLPSTMSRPNYDHDIIAYDLNGIEPDKNGAYALSSLATGDHPIAMGATVGSIYGQVTGDAGGTIIKLNNALVTITNSNGRVYTTYTDSNGYFSIECPYGSYELNVACSGFEHSEPLIVDPSEQESYTVVMTMNVNTAFLGLNLPHAFEVIGIGVITLILCVGFILYRMTQNKHSDIVAIDYPDEMEIEEDREDDLRS